MSRSIYLVLDMMNDLVHPDGVNGQAPYGVQARERGIVAHTRHAIDKARAAGLRVGQSPEDLDIVKHRVSPFYATSLEAVLRAQGVQRIYCSGISTNAVVQATVREGHDRDYEMVVLEDGCCALSAEEHEGAIRSLQRFCGLTNSRDVAFE
jgi:nicotinamidase-related amidase